MIGDFMGDKIAISAKTLILTGCRDKTPSDQWPNRRGTPGVPGLDIWKSQLNTSITFYKAFDSESSGKFCKTLPIQSSEKTAPGIALLDRNPSHRIMAL